MRQSWFGTYRSITASFVLAAVLFFPAASSSQGRVDPVRETVEQMQLITSGAVEVQLSPLSGLTTFVSSRQGAPAIPTGLKPSARPVDKARAFLADYGEAFGIQDLSQVRVLREVERDETGMEHVRFQQIHRGVHVTGGELTILSNLATRLEVPYISCRYNTAKLGLLRVVVYPPPAASCGDPSHAGIQT